MELKLSEEDTKQVLLEWAAEKFPALKFNEVQIEGYSYARSIILSYAEPEAKVEA